MQLNLPTSIARYSKLLIISSRCQLSQSLIDHLHMCLIELCTDHQYDSRTTPGTSVHRQIQCQCVCLTTQSLASHQPSTLPYFASFSILCWTRHTVEGCGWWSWTSWCLGVFSHDSRHVLKWSHLWVWSLVCMVSHTHWEVSSGKSRSL